jgi:hypothetical protein
MRNLGSDVRVRYVGLAKKIMMQEDEQGWSFTDGWVCGKCVDDYALAAAIDADLVDGQHCDSCHSSPAAPLDTLLEAFALGVRTEFDLAEEVLFWDGREGGFQGPTLDKWELVEEFGDVLVGPGLKDAVADALHDHLWVPVYFAHPSQDEALTWSWDRFKQAVLHETRYVFWLRKDEDEEQLRSWGEIPAARLLEELGQLIESSGLVRTLDAGSVFCRARPYRGERPNWGPKDLGTVPVDQSNKGTRMSPAGIPMFYGARDLDTALQEVAAATDEETATYGWFQVSKRCLVVDFTELPSIPSMFDSAGTNTRHGLIFLHSFIAELQTRPRPTFQEVDYVPTQVVTEYLLKVFGNGKDVRGLLYRSSLTDGVCVVLDIGNSRCVEIGQEWDEQDAVILGLDPLTVTWAPLPITSASELPAPL